MLTSSDKEVFEVEGIFQVSELSDCIVKNLPKCMSQTNDFSGMVSSPSTSTSSRGRELRSTFSAALKSLLEKQWAISLGDEELDVKLLLVVMIIPSAFYSPHR